MELEEYIKQKREEADSYSRTIQAIIAFDSAIRWDDSQEAYLQNSLFFPGRKLSKVHANTRRDLRPDIVIQLSGEYGIVAEIKITASSQQDFERAHEQIIKYDDNLIGWKTEDERIGLHDLSLLVNDFKRGVAKRYFEDKAFQRKFSLVACARVSESKEYFKIEKYYGSFSDSRIETKLSDPVPVPLEKILGKISRVKFYDAEPPIEYVMNVLWMNVFNEFSHKEEEQKKKEIPVSCTVATELLREKYAFPQEDTRQPKIPKKDWIRNALDAFIIIKYARRDISDNDKYLVRYSYPKKENMIDFFSRKHIEALRKVKKETSGSEQLEMIFNEE